MENIREDDYFGNKYGFCDRCKSPLRPVWFTEEEYKSYSIGHPIKTGRVRRACSHLECPNCFKNICVDDSFDRAWRSPVK